MSMVGQYCDAPIFSVEMAEEVIIPQWRQRHVPSISDRPDAAMETGNKMKGAHFLWLLQELCLVLQAFLTGLLTQNYFPFYCDRDSSFLIELLWFKAIFRIPGLGSSQGGKKAWNWSQITTITLKAWVVLRLKCFTISNKPKWADKSSLFSETVNNAAVFYEEAVFYLNPHLLSSAGEQRCAQKAGNLIFYISSEILVFASLGAGMLGFGLDLDTF